MKSHLIPTWSLRNIGGGRRRKHHGAKGGKSKKVKCCIGGSGGNAPLNLIRTIGTPIPGHGKGLRQRPQSRLIW